MNEETLLQRIKDLERENESIKARMNREYSDIWHYMKEITGRVR